MTQRGLRSRVTQLFVAYLRPHWRVLILIGVLLLVQAIGNLYLPSLNADIINNGVVKGDTALHPPRRRAHARAVGPAGRRVGRHGLLQRAHVDAVRPRRARRPLPARGGFSLRQMNAFGVPSLITRNTNDVQQVQMLVHDRR